MDTIAELMQGIHKKKEAYMMKHGREANTLIITDTEYKLMVEDMEKIIQRVNKNATTADAKNMVAKVNTYSGLRILIIPQIGECVVGHIEYTGTPDKVVDKNADKKE